MQQSRLFGNSCNYGKINRVNGLKNNKSNLNCKITINKMKFTEVGEFCGFDNEVFFCVFIL